MPVFRLIASELSAFLDSLGCRKCRCTGAREVAILMLLDFKLPLPEGMTISSAPPDQTREVRILEGAPSAAVAAAIESAAIRAGFAITRTSSRDTLLRRDDQAIYLFQRSELTLIVRFEDPRAFPVAGVLEGGVRIHDLEFTLKAEKILPGRERHLEGSREWSADWTVFGPSAAELTEQLQRAFIRIGLRANGIWAPAEGMNRWKVEASSPERLLQAEVFSEPDSCKVKIHLVTN
jgi:hypothetical protein